jgi:4-diphosphocytidyl-2C-methyl-D-erythritol kinase
VSNDFEAAVFDLAPELSALRQILLSEGATRVLLCGSGSALAAFTPDPMALWNSVRRRDIGDAWVVRPWYDDPNGRIRQRWS